MQGQTGQLRTLALLLTALSNFEKFTSTLPRSLPVTGTKETAIPRVVWRPGLWDWSYSLTVTKHQPFLKMEVSGEVFRKSHFSLHKIVTLK